MISIDKEARQSLMPPGQLPVRAPARVVAIDVATGSVKSIVDHGFAVVAQVAWMPDQKGIVAIGVAPAARNGQVWYVPYPTGEPQQVTRDGFDYRIVSLSGDGKSLLTVGSETIAGVLSRDAMLITGFRP
jgi:Tol biopolymer transport system component